MKEGSSEGECVFRQKILWDICTIRLASQPSLNLCLGNWIKFNCTLKYILVKG